MMKPKVCRLRTSNLVGGWNMRYHGHLERPVKLGYCTRVGAYRVGRIQRPHNLLQLERRRKTSRDGIETDTL